MQPTMVAKTIVKELVNGPTSETSYMVENLKESF